MPKYEVEIERLMRQKVKVTVEADSLDDAFGEVDDADDPADHAWNDVEIKSRHIANVRRVPCK